MTDNSTGNPTFAVQALGQSLWYDNLSRDLIESGDLQRLIADSGILGITSNPTIFERAIGQGTAYDDAIGTMLDRPAAQIFDRLAAVDIQHAADRLRPIYDRTHALDGYVSLEVSPLLADDTDKTIAEAKRLFAAIDRPNLMIKIPGTMAGLPAIEEVLFAGINVNVTLLFSVASYDQVIERYVHALERRLAAGLPIDRIASVASFFVSRIDGLIDKQLENNIRAAQGRDVDRVAANNTLLGKAAIANAKVAYKHFKTAFYGDRFTRLRSAGAHVQRLLWASTGTKNPAYPDTYYVNALIGADTVDTLPPATLAAFRDHGIAAATLETDLDTAQATLDKLAEVGIDLDITTQQLQEDGVEQFAESFRKLIAGVEGKVARLRSGVMDRQSLVLGEYQPDVEAAITKLDGIDAVKRIWARDASLWKADSEAAKAVTARLGWLAPIRDQVDHAQLIAFQAEAKAKSWRHVVLLGTGGSSGAADVLTRVFGSAEGFPALIVLDSTDPQAISTVEQAIDLAKTLFIVASKSGSTLEPLAMQRYFYPKYASAPGEHFMAITDSGSQLEKWARELHFAHVFLNPPDIGGRYAAFSYFGLIPAALIGVDLDRLFACAEEMQQACAANVAATHNPGIWLGVVLGTLGLKGRDKVTILTSPELTALGGWIAALLAASTGKEGRGLIPVANATIGHPHDYDDDRMIVYLALKESANNPDAEVRALQEAGHPLLTIHLRDRYDLIGEFFRWMFGTSVIGYQFGINPFDEPNVVESKANTTRLLATFNSTGHLPDNPPALTESDIQLFSDEATTRLLTEIAVQRDFQASPLIGALAAFLGLARSGEYIALIAFLPPLPAIEQSLSDAQRRIRHVTNRAITLDYGPRFLHTVGQLHKGGPNNGIFLQITMADQTDPHIPGANYGFSTLKQAQAAGDLEALRGHGRRVIRLHLTGDVINGLNSLEQAVAAIEAKQK